MARLGIQTKSRRKAKISGFNADYLNNRAGIRRRKKLGFLRTIFSSLSLILGASMIYVAFHYVPAFIQPKQVLKFVSGDSAAMKTYDFDRNSKIYTFFGPYAKLFALDRAYMKPGQSINIKYDLPKGAYAELHIVQCRRAWVKEIFSCDVVSRFNSRTKRRSGVESFELKHGGFYYFKNDVVNVPDGEPYRIVWERGI